LTRIVIDASVTLSWCFPDEQTPVALSVLDRLKGGEQAIVPAFWSVEVLNTLLLGERKGRITAEQTKAFFDILRVLNPALDYASLERVAGPVQVICRDHSSLHPMPSLTTSVGTALRSRITAAIIPFSMCPGTSRLAAQSPPLLIPSSLS